ncbi:MAG: site-specific integrase [Clostridiales bacterium]|nr:site-specific integrase [Clostridiales bacterium]
MNGQAWTLGAWLWEWYQIYKVPNLAPYSLRNIEQMIRLHIPETLKRLPLAELTAYGIEKELVKLGKTRTAVYARQVLFSALAKAERLGFISRNIMEAVEKVRYKKQRGKALSISEQTEFLRALEKSRYKWLMLFYLHTGVRRTEALTLEWRDVDYDGRVILIRGTKTEESFRYIPLTDDVAAILEGQRKQNKKERAKKHPRGRYADAPPSVVFPYGREPVSRAFKALCPAHHLHDLRHTFITRCAESGVNVTVCQQIVGHTTADMTLNVYTHVMDEFKRKELAKFTINPKF